MILATFPDGTTYRFDRVEGGGFNPDNGDRYLFEFPQGELKEGTVSFVGAPQLDEGPTIVNGRYDAQARTIAVEM